MTRHIIPSSAVAVLLFTMLAGKLPGKPAECMPLTEDTKDQVVEYVRYKYQLPTGTALKLSEAAAVEDTCYTKLRFSLTDPNRTRELHLFLTPDRRYLTRELLDTSINLREEERQQAERLKKGLADGVFPTVGNGQASSSIVIFSDFQCLYCRETASALQREIVPELGQETRLVFRHLPLPMHTWAAPAAEAHSAAFRALLLLHVVAARQIPHL